MRLWRHTPSGRGADAAAGTFEADALSHVDRIYGAALRLTRNRADAEDLVQDTYLKAFRARGRFEPGTNVRAWLFTILHNTFLNERRRTSRDLATADSDQLERAVDQGAGAVETPEQLMMRATLDADLKSALDAIPEAFRQAVWLRDVEEFSYAEIAKMLNVPIGTVMSRISRGRRLLHQRLSLKRRDPGPLSARSAQPA